MHEGEEDETEANGQGEDGVPPRDAPVGGNGGGRRGERRRRRAAQRSDPDRSRRAPDRHRRERAVRVRRADHAGAPRARSLPARAAPSCAAALAALADRAERDRRGIRLVEVAGGYQFRTAPEHAEWVRRLFQQRPWRLTRATLETLAIVAYKQPITRAEIEAIRGVDVDSVLASLLARKLVKIVGRKDVIGRPLLYGTTRQFLEVFGLRDLAALPGLSEVAAAMPDSVGAGAAGGDDETWSGDDRQDEGHTPAEAAGGLGDLLPTSSGDDDPERTGDRERQDGQDPGESGASD